MILNYTFLLLLICIIRFWSTLTRLLNLLLARSTQNWKIYLLFDIPTEKLCLSSFLLFLSSFIYKLKIIHFIIFTSETFKFIWSLYQISIGINTSNNWFRKAAYLIFTQTQHSMRAPSQRCRARIKYIIFIYFITFELNLSDLFLLINFHFNKQILN